MALGGEHGKRRGAQSGMACIGAARSMSVCRWTGSLNGRRGKVQAITNSGSKGAMAPKGLGGGSHAAPHYCALGYAWVRGPVPVIDSGVDISCNFSRYPGSMRTQVKAPCSHHHLADRPIVLDRTVAGWMEGGVVAVGEEEERGGDGRCARLLQRRPRGRGHRSLPCGCGIVHCFFIFHCRGLYLVSSDGPMGPTMHSDTAAADGVATRGRLEMGMAPHGSAWTFHLDSARRGLLTRFGGAVGCHGPITAEARSWRATPDIVTDPSGSAHKAVRLRARRKGVWLLIHRPGVGILPRGHDRRRN